LELACRTNAGQVVLTWEAVTGASNYTVSRNWEPEISPTGATSHSEAMPVVGSGYLVTAYDAGGTVLAAEGVRVLESECPPLENKDPARPKRLRVE
jgi:hypothetical protein